MIESTLHEPTRTAQQVCQDMHLEQGAFLESPLSHETILAILDQRYYFNGVPKLQEMYERERKDAMMRRNYDEYARIVYEFQDAINDRTNRNLQELLMTIGMTDEQFWHDYRTQWPPGTYDETML